MLLSVRRAIDGDLMARHAECRRRNGHNEADVTALWISDACDPVGHRSASIFFLFLPLACYLIINYSVTLFFCAL